MPFTRRRLFAATAAMIGAVGGLVTWRTAQARYYDGPVSDHFDGVRFFDAHGSPPNSTASLLRWWTTRERAAWPEWAPSPHRDRPPRRVDGPAWRIAFVGHASLLIQTAGLNMLIDPVWSERVSPLSFYGPKRVNAPGIAFDASAAD